MTPTWPLRLKGHPMNAPQHRPSANKNDAALDYIAARWPHLPPHVRDAILTLVDAARVADADRCESSPVRTAKGAL